MRAEISRTAVWRGVRRSRSLRFCATRRKNAAEAECKVLRARPRPGPSNISYGDKIQALIQPNQAKQQNREDQTTLVDDYISGGYSPSGGEPDGGVLRLVHVHLHPEVDAAAVPLLHPLQPELAAEQLAAVGHPQRAVKRGHEVGTAEGDTWVG